MVVNDTYHLTYCTNIHPGDDWQQTFESLEQYVLKVKNEISPNAPFGIGLRLSNKASEELGQGDTLRTFKTWLADKQLYVFTMNGFPYGNFHKERVKDMVHAPDWTTDERVQYTMRLFDQLAFLVPNGLSGGISTSPISYKHWHANTSSIEEVLKKGAANLTKIISHLSKIEKDTGVYLHLDIEPEPDGLLENSDEVVHFFTRYLLPMAKNSLGLGEKEAEGLVYRYINICYDICHFSLAYEEPEVSFRKFRDAGIQVGKIQVSSALKILFGETDSAQIWAALALFNEPTYLHQVTEKKEGTVRTYNDLPLVLANKKEFSELRSHFHVPIFLERFEKLYSTQDQIIKVVDYLKREKVSEHLEIETYTWDVLPPALKTNLSDSIIREMDWFKSTLLGHK